MPPPPLTRLCEFRTSEGSILVPYALQRRRGMRYLRVSVDAANAVTLRVPYRVSETQAVEFLQSQATWVLKMLARVPRRITLREFLEEQRWIAADGRKWTLRWSWSSRHASLHLEPEAEAVEFRVNPALPLDPQIANLLRAMGRTVLSARVHQLASGHGLTARRVTIRDQRSRWGACTDRGTISLNWRLLLLAPNLQDHIILHELAHFTHMNHSAAFWKLLEHYDPQCEAHDREITRRSAELMRLGR